MKIEPILLRWQTLLLVAIVAGATTLPVGGATPPQPVQEGDYPAAGLQPGSKPGWQEYLTRPDPSAPEDEAQSGKTLSGTPITPRSEWCFPAETRNLFHDVDMIASGPNGELNPIDYQHDASGNISKDAREAIEGQNTWMLWAEGNEAFWGWLQEHGYGLTDFLIMLDSRQRETRFDRLGFINQPGMKASDDNDPLYQLLGLHLDCADGPAITMQPPDWDKIAQPKPPPSPDHKNTSLFAGGDDRGLYEAVLKALPKDGVDPAIYGYPSGVVGVRLFPNPDFFGTTKEAAAARSYWQIQVMATKDTSDNYYVFDDPPKSASPVDRKDPAWKLKYKYIHDDPDLVRPFRVGLSCAFCHVGPHPLNPPANVEEPEWKNLSSIIGNQYWSPPHAFASTTPQSNFIYHFLNSQQPGTIDTSLVSTDHINNPNTINAIFEVPARLDWAGKKPPEAQSAANEIIPSLEDGIPLSNPRHTPGVLLDGADSIGVFGALARVYLNIGTYPEEWNRCDNPLIGYTLQQPFSVATLQEKSVYWRASVDYRTRYLKKFFGYQTSTPVTYQLDAPPAQSATASAAAFSTNAPPLAATPPPVITLTKGRGDINCVTAPMRLVNAKDDGLARRFSGHAYLDQDMVNIHGGRALFIHNCAICHSSKQPDQFELKFSDDWNQASVPKDSDPPHYVAPLKYSQWKDFLLSAAYQNYVGRMDKLAGPGPALGNYNDPFIDDNYLSTDIRIPISLVGTNSQRAMATNGMRGQVWDNFSSETYKSLPSVGRIRFYNPFSSEGLLDDRCNDSYVAPSGGPGYYRPASLVSLWATAPYLHNNSLGFYNRDPSIAGPDVVDPTSKARVIGGRLGAFEDGIEKMLHKEDREKIKGDRREGDLRGGPDSYLATELLSDPSYVNSVVHPDSHSDQVQPPPGDPGFIYRTPLVTWFSIPAPFIHQLLIGVLGPFLTSALLSYLWLGLILLLLVFVGITVIVDGAGQRLAGLVLFLLSFLAGSVIVVTHFDRVYGPALWLVPAVLILLALAYWTIWRAAWAAQIVFVVLALLALAIRYEAHQFVNGQLGPIVLGPIPEGTPVNLIMNFNPEAPLELKVNGATGLLRGCLLLQEKGLNVNDTKAEKVEALYLFEKEAGLPLLKASKCPDFVLDRGHWFGETLSDQEKNQLKAYLKTF
jgi:hypothetical protein